MWASKTLWSFIQDDRGNFYAIAAVAMVPILMGIGMAIDISRQQSMATKLQNAADAAALHAAIISGTVDDDAAEAEALAILQSNLGNLDITIDDFDLVESSDGTMDVVVDATLDSLFAQVNGFPHLGLSVHSEAAVDSGGDLEMTIAFDTTSSMGFGSTWQTALGTLDTVLTEIDNYSGTNNFFISLVPFSDRVNVGTSRTNWLAGATPASWNGCVEPREEDNGTVSWALDDDKPTGSNRFQASIPGVTGGLTGFNNNFPYCPNVAIVPPTNNVDTVINAAAAFSKAGTGRFDVAMAWTWRLLSDDWRGHWSSGGNAAANNGHDRRKIAIMVTDGKTEAYTWEVDQTSSWGWNNGSVGGFENMVAVCDGMKADGMELFMIRVNGNSHATAYMQDCASTDAHYFEITDNAGLEIAFRDILKVVKSNVRLVN